ncbi:MAG: hypothetical protein AAB348_03230 [Patescibacteria group bacterium]
MFLSNKHSFLLIRSEIKNPIIQYSIQESVTSLSRRVGLDPEVASEPPSSSISDFDNPIAGSLFLPKKADALIMGSSPTTGVVGVKNSTNARINPATEETLDEVLKKTDLSLDAGVLQVKVTAVSGAGSSSFSNSANTPTSGRVDDTTRNVWVDVKAIPSTASTETTLQTISFGGKQFALRLATDGNVDYVGEALAGILPDATGWRIKKIDSTTGIIITWADGSAGLDKIWDNGVTSYTSYTYS